MGLWLVPFKPQNKYLFPLKLPNKLYIVVLFSTKKRRARLPPQKQTGATHYSEVTDEPHEARLDLSASVRPERPFRPRLCLLAWSFHVARNHERQLRRLALDLDGASKSRRTDAAERRLRCGVFCCCYWFFVCFLFPPFFLFAAHVFWFPSEQTHRLKLFLVPTHVFLFPSGKPIGLRRNYFTGHIAIFSRGLQQMEA